MCFLSNHTNPIKIKSLKTAPLYLLLGSNLGDKLRYLNLAKEFINEYLGEIVVSSPIYYTQAWGNENQDTFINLALEVNNVNLEPHIILKTIKDIENKIGRTKNEKWGAREIDIDILYYGSLVFKSESLEIPHKYISDRKFALYPMVAIAPDFIHPVYLCNQTDLLLQCIDTLEVKEYFE